jgi:hypothetical protein
VVAEARADKDAVAMRRETWEAKPAFVVQYRNGDVIRHVFGADGKEIAFYWYPDHNVTKKEIGKIQRIFRTQWHAGAPIAAGWANWTSENGLVLGVHNRYLCILDTNRIQEIPGGSESEASTQNAPRAIPVHPEDEPWPGVPLDSPHEARLQRAQTALETPAPTAAPSVASKPAPTDQNDCLPFALEALARLKKSSHWAEIAGFTWIEDGTEIGGHAVVFYQPTEKTNVFMYDRSGSYDLQTRSHDLAEIIAALNQLTRDNLRVESPRWLESDDSREEFASSKSDRQPNWSSTAPTTSEQTAEQITIVFLGILMWILMLGVSVICFLKGKPVFGTLGLFSGALSWWAIVGAIRIAKPGSWWARKKYGPDKMTIAHQRFTSFYNQPPPPPPAAIIDDPVERALERVKRNNPAVISQPNEIESRPSHTKSLWKTIASAFGTVIFWLGFILCNTYLLIVFITFVVLWQREYCSLTISGLIAVGAWLVLRNASGFIVMAGISLKSLGSEEDDYV